MLVFLLGVVATSMVCPPHGLVAQRESVRLTRGRSLVRSQPGPLRDIDPDDLAETICVSVLGSHLLSDAMGDDLFARLTRAWRIMLRGAVPHTSRRYFDDFLSRTYLQHLQASERQKAFQVVG